MGWYSRWAERRMEKGRRIIAEAEAAGHPTTMPNLRETFADVKRQAYDSFGDTFDDRAGVIDPRGADFKHPPAEDEDPARREATVAAERAAREAARNPYRENEGSLPSFSRVATTGAGQLDAVAAALRGLSPDRVYGVYRVPDRYDEQRTTEDKAYLEWEIVHAPDAEAPAAGPVELTAFSRLDHWARRSPGEPRVLDEDMGAALIDRARLAPEDCFGLTRLWQVRSQPDDSGRWPAAKVEGSMVVARPGGDAARHALAAAAPLELGPPTFHVTVLDWEAVAAWIAPKPWKGTRVPSPLPHLPDTPQELLRAYLEIVGVRAADCYGAQITRTTEGLIPDLGIAGVSRGRNDPPFPCADGQQRPRLNAAEHVVVAYRDTPGYAEGRRRWAAYEDEVLFARLSHLTDVRPPLVVSDTTPEPFLLEVANMFNPLDPMHDFPQIFNRNERPLIGPYCGRLP